MIWVSFVICGVLRNINNDMKPIIYIKGSEIEDVRLQKFLNFFVEKRENVSFWGWSRLKKKMEMKGVNSICLLSGGGYGKRGKLFFYYILWLFVVFFKCLRTNLKDKIIIAIDFDSALPVYWASKFKKIDYIYEVYDDFALRYRFPSFVKSFVHNKDVKIMRNAKCVIHVDSNRVIFKDCKWIVIENTPNDFFDGAFRYYNEIEYLFAVTGHFSNQRGLRSIYEFAKNTPQAKFLIVGNFQQKEDEKDLCALPNVMHYGFMPQKELFKKMEHCCSIFSLYDPKVEINRLAASNKVYDAMMFGIPVITNKEVVNSDFIKENNLGFVVDYDYNETWDCLSSDSFMGKVKEMGNKGRELYLNNYRFPQLVTQRLVPILENI
jgi:glycosyltransferase involved in cell wall biosynthesis